jgi:3-isopropylmalate/(R)-2-methylmalate dehydratase large subunit
MSAASMSTSPNAKPTGATLAQKLIARAAGREQVSVGEVLTCQVDLAMFHDSSGPRRLKPMLADIGAQIWDRNKVVLVLDHYVPAQDADSQKIVQVTRDVAKEWQLPHVIDSEGICHVVLPERGHLKPGYFCVGGDSHSPTGGFAHGVVRCLAKRRLRQRHDAAHDWQVRHERWQLPSR